MRRKKRLAAVNLRNYASISPILTSSWSRETEISNGADNSDTHRQKSIEFADIFFEKISIYYVRDLCTNC